MPSAVQLRLQLPGEPVSASAGMTESEIVSLAADALHDAPALRQTPSESALRAVVAWAVSDRQSMTARDVADLAGVSDRTLQRWRLAEWWRPALLAVVERLRPPGFRLLSAVLDELAASLADDLRFGRRKLSNLSDAELKLVSTASGDGREVNVITPDGVEVAVHDARQDPDLDRLTNLGDSADVGVSEGVGVKSCRGATSDVEAGAGASAGAGVGGGTVRAGVAAVTEAGGEAGGEAGEAGGGCRNRSRLGFEAGDDVQNEGDDR